MKMSPTERNVFLRHIVIEKDSDGHEGSRASGHDRVHQDDPVVLKRERRAPEKGDLRKDGSHGRKFTLKHLRFTGKSTPEIFLRF